MSHQAVPVQPSRGPSMLVGVVAGLATALIAAVVWAVLVGFVHRQFGVVAVGVGAAVGLVMARTGRLHPVVPPIAAVFAVLGCALGKLLGAVVLVSIAQGTSIFDVLIKLLRDPALVGDLFIAAYSPLDLLFWAIAAVAAFRIARGAVEENELESAQVAAAMASPRYGTPPASQLPPPSPYAGGVAQPQPEPRPETEPKSETDPA